MSVNDTNGTLCPLCGGRGRITGGFRYRESSAPQTRSCPACNGDGGNHHNFETWYDWVCTKIVQLEISVRTGRLTLSGGMLRVAAEVAGFDEYTPVGRFAITSFAQQLEKHRTKQIEVDPEAKKVLKATTYGAASISCERLSDPNFDVQQFIDSVTGFRDRGSSDSDNGNAGMC